MYRTTKTDLPRMRNNQLFIAVIIIILLAGTYLYNKYRIAPDVKFDTLRISDLQGRPVQIETFRNRILFINFFATWCGPCVSELPSLYSASKKLEKNNFQFIYISDEPIERLTAFRNRLQLPIAIYHSETSLQQQNIYTIPTNYILNNNFEIVYKKVGLEDWENPEVLEKLIALPL